MPLRRRLSHLKDRLRDTLESAQEMALARVAKEAPLEKSGPEPPVVARLMVEIRSDGSRTIARGALEDAASGERVAVEAQGATPAQLAVSLARALVTTPLLAAAAVRAVLDGGRKSSPDRGRSAEGDPPEDDRA